MLSITCTAYSSLPLATCVWPSYFRINRTLAKETSHCPFRKGESQLAYGLCLYNCQHLPGRSVRKTSMLPRSATVT